MSRVVHPVKVDTLTRVSVFDILYPSRCFTIESRAIITCDRVGIFDFSAELTVSDFVVSSDLFSSTESQLEFYVVCSPAVFQLYAISASLFC